MTIMFPSVSSFSVIMSILTAVLESSAETGPELEKSEVHINITAGRTAILPCMVYQMSSSNTIVWQSPNRGVISYGTHKVTTDMRFRVDRPYEPDWNLHISSVEPSDHGEYKCQLNTKPVQQKKVFLHVQVPPDISESKTTAVPEGETLKIFCNASGQPKPTVTWFKNGVVLKNNSEVLEVPGITRDRVGTYRCKATNTIEPEAERVVAVDVLYRPEVATTAAKLSQLKGKEAILECKVRANPYQKFIWNRDGEALPHLPWKYKKEEFANDADSQIMQLRIMLLESEDFGRYQCKARNELGSDSDVIFLTELTTERPTTTDKKSSAFPKSSTTTPNDQLHSTTISSKQTANGKIVNPPITNKYTEATNINSETAEKYGTNGKDKNVIKVDTNKSRGISQYYHSINTFTLIVSLSAFLNYLFVS